VQKEKDPVAEAIRLLAAVVLFAVLLGAGFYAKAHHIDSTLFWWGSAIVFFGGIIDAIT
jgi:hypothetical protein